MKYKYLRILIDSATVVGYSSAVAPFGRPLNHSNANRFTNFALPCALAVARGVTHGGATFKTMAQELIEELRAFISYDPETGILTWKKRINSRALEGAECGTPHWIGYRRIQFNNRIYQSHRVAWAIHYGGWPKHELDHINRVRDDNRICNLREATSSENRCNRTFLGGRTSGHTGVGWHTSNKKWRGRVKDLGKEHIKYFTSLDEAAEWVKQKRAELHGEFAAKH